MTIVHVDHQIDSKEIARRVWEKDHAEVDLSTLTLEQLVDRVRTEHEQVEGHLSGVLRHAIRAGRALLEIRGRMTEHEWKQWLASVDLGVGFVTFHRYLRFAYYESVLAGVDERVTMTDAVRILRGYPPVRTVTPGKPAGHPPEMKETAEFLSEQGMSQSQIAAELEVGHRTVRRWLMTPDQKRREDAAIAAAHRRRRAERKALKEQQAREERDRLARERGGNLGKAYDVVRKLQPVIDAAMAEGLSVEARALAVRLEDEIFKALKS